jgi:hypothetical protein
MTVTLLQLKNAARQRADMSGSAGPDQFVDDAELTGYINASLAEFNDLVVVKNLLNYVTSSVFTLTGNTSNSNYYTLSSSFYKLAGVDRLLDGSVSGGTAVWYDVNKFAFNERNFGNNPIFPLFRPPYVKYRIIGNNLVFMPALTSAGTYQIWWYPQAPVLSSNTDTIDETQYWWDYVVVDAAIKMLAKEESDVTILAAQKMALKDRIESMAADRDYGQPEQIGSRRAAGGGFGGDMGGGGFGYGW